MLESHKMKESEGRRENVATVKLNKERLILGE